MSTRRTHPLEWVSLGFAVVALSYTEWSLAVAAGAHPFVAVAVPGALDVYAVRAMRVRKHVPLVVFAMLTVNALGYLVRAGVLDMTWPVLIVVSAIAPLTFWAVHVLGHGEAVPDMAEARRRTFWGVPQDAQLEWDTFDAHVASVPGVRDMDAGTDLRTALGRRHTDPVREHTVPEDWGTPEHTVSDEPDTPGHTNVLTLPLPGGYEHGVPSTGDRDAAAVWCEWFDQYDGLPSLRTVKSTCGVSTDRARTMLKIWKGEVK